MADRAAAGRKQKKLIYLYGVTASHGAAVKLRGVDGLAPVETLDDAGLTCWISRVPAAVYGDTLAQHMDNLEWLAEASVLHQQVVAEIAARADVLPARFGTVFADESSLARHVAESKKKIIAALKRIAGAEEWGVKVFAERRAAALSPDVRTGKDYLKAKAATLPERSPRGADPELATFAQALKKLSEEVATGGQISAGQRNLVWQGSFLVRRSRHKQWRAVLQRFASKWGEARRIEVTGPWPPYSFVRTDA